MIFDRPWFIRYQSILVWLLNTPVVRVLFRRALCIHHSSVGNKKILAILPHALFWQGTHDKEYVAEFRSHDKFGKRLFYSFYPLWRAMHWWDMTIANTVVPRYNLGFDTLGPLYPAAGANSPVDGTVQRDTVDETFSTIRGGAGNAHSVTSVAIAGGLEASTTTDQYDFLQRFISCFDTSPLTASATVTAAVLSLYGRAQQNDLGDSPELHICAATPAATNDLVDADYGQLGTTSFASIAYASWSLVGYNDFTLNASGIANISLTGISKFGGRLNWDINNNFTGTWTSAGFTQMNAFSADQTGTDKDPKLVITYTVSTTHFLSLLGVGT